MNMISVCSDGVSSQNNYEDETVVEKTILMLEYEKPSPVRPAAEEKILVQSLKSALDPTKGKIYKGMAVHPQISPSDVKEINEGTVECQLTKAEAARCAEKVLPNISTVKVTEKPYNAPYARVSSLEDPCIEKSEYERAPSAVDTTTAASELTTVHGSSGTQQQLSDSEQHKFDKMWEVSEKPMEKESFKGLKQLFKFGRKRRNSIAGEFNLVADVANHDGSIADYKSHVASSGDVASFKPLISQGEGSSTHTPVHKPSRSFSLLLSFWIKTSEKKLSK